MDLIEYLLFIPLLIYGIALSNLLAQWKRLFDFSNWHWPFIVTIVVFTETAIWNIFQFLDVFTQRATHSYVSYLVDLAAPFTFMLSVNALLPRADSDQEVDPEEFESRVRLTYGFAAVFVALHLSPQFRAVADLDWIRIPGIALMLAIAWTRKHWLIYVLGALWAVNLVQRLMTI